MKVLIKVFSILLLIIGAALSAALYLAFSDMRLLGARSLGYPETSVDESGNFHMIIRLRVYNNGSYLTLSNSNVVMKILDDQGNVVSSDKKFFTLGPKKYIDLSFHLVIPVETYLAFLNDTIKLFISTKLTAVTTYKSIVLLAYSLESISEMKKMGA